MISVLWKILVVRHGGEKLSEVKLYWASMGWLIGSLTSDTSEPGNAHIEARLARPRSVCCGLCNTHSLDLLRRRPYEMLEYMLLSSRFSSDLARREQVARNDRQYLVNLKSSALQPLPYLGHRGMNWPTALENGPRHSF